MSRPVREATLDRPAETRPDPRGVAGPGPTEPSNGADPFRAKEASDGSDARPVEAHAARKKLPELLRTLETVIRGKPEAIRRLVVSLLAGGSVLLEDVPGVGKTTLAKALARAIDVSFSRVQFTPDLLPGDILGSSIYNPQDATFRFREGPIFCHVLLADEINRASPRTQSALLEAMSENQATIEGVRHALPQPFLVLATQNPIEYQGTYPLPEAQLDRFLVQLDLGYPDLPTEVEILRAQAESHPLEAVRPVLSGSEVASLQRAVHHVRMDDAVAQYLVEIVRATRTDARLRLGVSPRGSLMLFRAAQAAAYLAGRDHVLPDDVQDLAVCVLAHRLVLTSKARYADSDKGRIVREIVERLPVPT